MYNLGVVWLQLQNKFLPKKSSLQISEYTKTSNNFWMNNVQTENTYLFYSCPVANYGG
jgi:hypothetical protein